MHTYTDLDVKLVNIIAAIIIATRRVCVDFIYIDDKVI